ncbi:hypothetical protein JR316_0006728 [Psilocybe cubensis]|uniref:Uncharacterized protein n=2 Tax=Psilocybe cubensis TaxID=181762 RepID=A0A8H7XPB1_PSICU|nr:hypothetical protein JR316_0006728 [Psilocybe cubensis]KAH9480131.1 hypothetical protein JR316_0006728 [Psilocybe cubensis]
MSTSKHHKLYLYLFMDEYGDDAAVTESFVSQLEDHILSWVLGHSDGEQNVIYSDEQHAQVNILGDRVYIHKVLRINYTTYDMQREQDSINPRNHCNVMTLSRDGDPRSFHHPYLFVDRDMFICYLGYGIGHKSTNDYTWNMRPVYFGHYAELEEEFQEVGDDADKGNLPITAKQEAAMDASESEDDNDSEQED